MLTAEERAEKYGDKDLDEQTCLECYQFKVCHRWFGVCEDCFRGVVWPAIGHNFTQKEAAPSPEVAPVPPSPSP